MKRLLSRSIFHCVVMAITLLVGLMLIGRASFGADPEPADPKHAPPSAAEQKNLGRQIDQLYHQDMLAAKSAKDKLALAERFLTLAKTAAVGPERFVLTSMARDLAARGGSASLAFRAIDDLADAFEIDAIKMRADALFLASKVEGGAAAEDFQLVIDSAIAADRYDVAKQTAQAASAYAGHSGKLPIVRWAATLNHEVDERSTAFRSAATAQAILLKTPNDPAATLTVGRYVCLFKEDWDRGLPLLAASNDAVLQPLAKADSAGASTPGEKVSLGDKWLAAAQSQTGMVRRAEENRAAMWYRAALPDLKGLARSAVDKKLESVVAHTWLVLFRSADPSIWNTSTSAGSDSMALPLSRCPADVRYIKLTAGNARVAILPITKDQLGKLNTGSKFNWNGSAHKEWGATHLGICNDISMAGKGTGFIVTSEGFKGWGFGHKVGVDDKQYWTWATEEIPSTVFEISVTAAPLTPDEAKFLLR